MTESGKDLFLKQVRENEGLIYKLARLYARDTHEVEDMYQETLLQAWKSWPSFKGESRFSTWLYRICLNTLLTHKRKTNVLRHATDLDTIPDGIMFNPEEDERVKALYTAMRTLGETDRALISLHLDGFANTEISKIAGISANHVAVKLHRIKEQLQNIFKNQGL